MCGDDERLQRGKPFADVFLLAAREGLGEPSKWQPIVREPGLEHDGTFKGGEGQFLVFEDATVSEEPIGAGLLRPLTRAAIGLRYHQGGVQAAKAAGMQVVWVPDPQVSSLAGMRAQPWNQPNRCPTSCLASCEPSQTRKRLLQL